MTALSEARTAMVGVHAGLEEAKLRLGIRTRLAYELKQNLEADDQVEMRDVG
jgi:hypothetical protein